MQEHPGGRKYCPCDECVQRRREIKHQNYMQHRTARLARQRQHRAQPHVKERIRQYDQEYHAWNHEHRLAQQREYRQREDVKARDRELQRRYVQDGRNAERSAQWRARNPERSNSYNHTLARREARLSWVGRKKREKYLAPLRAIPAPCSGMRWTPEDNVTVMRNDISTIEKAYLLGRSYGAINARRALLRQRGWPRAA